MKNVFKKYLNKNTTLSPIEDDFEIVLLSSNKTTPPLPDINLN